MIPDRWNTWKLAGKWVFGFLFIFAGMLHFVRPEFYLKIMPPYLPWHRELVFLSGVIEIVLGVLLLIPTTSTIAAWGADRPAHCRLPSKYSCVSASGTDHSPAVASSTEASASRCAHSLGLCIYRSAGQGGSPEGSRNLREVNSGH